MCCWKNNSHSDDSLERVLQESHNAGDVHATRLTPQQVHALEPNLSQECTGAVHIPGEIVLDPWLYSIALATHACENGATIYTNFEMNPEKSTWNCKTQTWTISSVPSTSTTRNDHVPKELFAKTVVNAAGVHADLVQLGVSNNNNKEIPAWILLIGRHNHVEVNIASFLPLKIRRFNIRFNQCQLNLQREFLCFSSIYNQIVVGPTALDQTSRTDTSLDSHVASQLSNYARIFFRICNPTNTMLATMSEFDQEPIIVIIKFDFIQPNIGL